MRYIPSFQTNFFVSDEEKLTQVTLIITNSHIALAEENHQWPLPRLHDPPKLLSGPQFVMKKKQEIINITDVVRSLINLLNLN